MLLLAGAAIGLLPSTDLAVSVQKLAAMALAVTLVLGIPRLSRTWRPRLCWAMLALGVAASVAGNILVDRNSWKLNALNRPVYALFANVPRFSDLAFSQNGLAALLVLVIPLGAALACRSRFRLLAGAFTAALVFELLLTESRAAVLGLGLASGTIVWLASSRSRWLALAVPIVAVVVAASGTLMLPMTAGWLPTGGSSAERLAIWLSSLLMIADLPLTGIGLGMFQRVYPLYILPAYENVHPHAHNLFLQTYLDAGPLGCAGIVVLASAGLWAIGRSRSQRPLEPLAVGAAVSTVGVLLQAQVDCYFAGDPRTYFLMFVPLGLLLAYAPMPGPRLGRVGRRAAALSTVGIGLACTPWLAPILWANAGSVARLQGRAQAAQADFTRALELRPRSWVAERGLGLVEGSSRVLSDAIGDGAPGPLVHLELAQVLYASGDEHRAVQEWRRARAAPLLARSGDAHLVELAAEVDPSDPTTLLNLAEMDLARGRWSSAERELEARLELRDPAPASSAEAHLLLGLTAYWVDREPAVALHQLRAAIAVNPNDESLYRGLADVLEQLGQEAPAADLRAQADTVAQDTARTKDTLGRAYQALGANPVVLRLARREYERVATADPIGHYDLGQLELAAGRLSEGLPQLEAAVKAIPNQEQFRLGLARAYASTGDLPAARRQYAAILDLDPGNAEARQAANA